MIGSLPTDMTFISLSVVAVTCGADALFMVLLLLMLAMVLALSIIVDHYDAIPLVERLAPAVGRGLRNALPARS